MIKMIGIKLSFKIRNKVNNRTFYQKKGTLEQQLKIICTTVKKYGKQLKQVIQSKKAQSVPTIINSCNNKISTTKETANSFNTFITSVGKSYM